MASFPYDELRAAGYESVVVRYNGHGDEGWIEEIEPMPDALELPDELRESVRNAAYDVLEDNYAGWEINEGSDGTITIDVKAGKATIKHGWVVESHEWETKEV
jgi:hypothetical protein